VSSSAPSHGPTVAERFHRALRRAELGAAAALRTGALATRGLWLHEDRRRRLVVAIGSFAILAACTALLFASFQWNWLRGPLAGYASAETGRRIQILGDLDVRPFSWTPWASVNGLRIGNPRWMKGGDAADIERITVQVRLKSLLTPHPDILLFDTERPRLSLFRDREGHDNWTLAKSRPGAASFPPIRRFVLNDGRIRLVDQQRRLLFDGVASTTDSSVQAAGGGFVLRGAGALNGQAFSAAASGGPLLNVRRDRPYPFDFRVRMGSTSVGARGQITRPFDLGRMNAAVSASGADLADLYRLTGVVFPNTPNYRLNVRLQRDGDTYVLRGLNGHVGASDLRGALTLEQRGGRKFLRGDLASTTLNFADLNAVMGGPAAGKAKGGAKAPGATVQTASNGKVLPDAPLDAARVRAMDADVHYRADSVRAQALPLRAASMHLVLDHGLMRIDPLAFDFPQGRLAGKVALDARRATPVTRLDVTVRNVRAQSVIKTGGGPPAIEGSIEARARLTGAGDSVHKAAAASNGEIAVAIPAGRMRKAFAELMGVNLAPGLFELWSKDPKQTDLRCAVADFEVRDGAMTVKQLVVDTKSVTLSGQGSANLGAETIDFTLKGRTKKPRILHLVAPFHVRGTFSRPTFKIEAGTAAAQLGIGAALGALAAPLAAILPLLAPGGAHDANCGALLEQAQLARAPVQLAAGQTPVRR
jgi:uncharacterized protein involved in outer membrane biogenesis